MTLAALVIVHDGIGWPERLQSLTVAIAPIAVVAATYTSSRLVYGLDMVHAVGFAVWPSPRTLGWTFIIAGALGLLRSVFSREARTVAVMLLAIALQGAVLVRTGLTSGATAPYLTLKMSYLAIYPMAVGAATMLATVFQALRPFGRVAWAPPILVALAAGRAMAFPPAVHPVVTQPVFFAGNWARTRFPSDCVDYLVADGYSAYWLHLAVFGNPRAAGRSLDDDTFDPKKALVRWILPDGLRYAIAGDFDALPRDIRDHVDVLARFGPAAVVQRRGPSRCP
jgi:hypothetical protein